MAQRQLYEAFAPVMLGVCYRYTKNTTDAHDLLQEGFIRVFKNLAQWRGDGELAAWIRRIMVNTCLNWLRSQQRLQFTQQEEIAEAQLPQVYNEAVQQLEAKQLATFIRNLPAGFQTVFNLHAIEGYSHAEIAELLGITEGTSRSQYLRARRQLAHWIEQEFATQINSYAGK